MAKTTKNGKIVSVKMQKTVIVEVNERKAHPLYKRLVKKTKHFMAHTDEQLKEGDLVVISSTKPLSAHKKWQVIEVISHGAK